MTKVSGNYLFVNENARRVSDALAREILRELERVGLPCELVLTSSVEHARKTSRRLAESGARLAIVAGGDGSINSVAQGLVGTETALGVIPLGTGNVLARELGMPLSWRKAVRWLPTLRPHRVDMAWSSAGCFLLMAGMGLDTCVIRGVRTRVKRLLGRGAFVLSACRVARKFSPFQAHIELDGETIDVRAWLVVVSNTASYAGVITLAPGATYYDGVLDLVVLPESTMPLGSLAWQTVANVLWGREMCGAIRRRCRALRVVTDPVVGVQLDGDPRAQTPFEARVLPAALRLLAPGPEIRADEGEVGQ